MNANKAKPKTARSQAKSLPAFDDILDSLDFFENTDMGDFLDTLEEVPEAEFKAETRRLRREWTETSDEDKQVVRVGEAILERLLLRGMRQSELARRLGKDRAWVTRVVQGRENPTVRTLSQLATVLECDAADLLRPVSSSVTMGKIHRPAGIDSQRTIADARPILRLLRGGFASAEHIRSQQKNEEDNEPERTVLLDERDLAA